MYLVEEKLLELQGKIDNARAGLKAKLTSKGVSFGVNDTLRKLISLIPKKFTRPVNLSKSLYKHTAVNCENGVLLTGINVNLVYNIENATFNSKTEYNSVFDHTAVKINRNMVLMSGGAVPGSGYLNLQKTFDLDSNTFQSKNNLPQRISRHSGANIVSNVLLSGGEIISGQDLNKLNNQYLYNVNSNNFTNRANLPSSTYDHTAVSLSDNEVLFTGGATQHIVYNYSTNAFTTKSNWYLNIFYCSATKVNNDVLVCGGTDGVSIFNKQYAYMVTSNTKTAKRNYPQNVREHTAVTINQTGVLYTGGRERDDYHTNQNIFDVNVNSFV